MRGGPQQEGEGGAEAFVGGDRDWMRPAAALVASSEPHPAHQRSGTCPGVKNRFPTLQEKLRTGETHPKTSKRLQKG